jgi:predicted esterase
MFRDLLKNYMRLGEKQYGIVFHFMEAKYDHPNGGKTWYKRPLDVKEIGKIPYDEELVKDTLDDLTKVIKDNSIDVLLGFSQGANVVDTFLAYRGDPNIKRAVIMSGYSLVDHDRKKEINVPIVGVISEADDVVPHNLNPGNYTESYVINHDKGHKLPTSNGIIRQLCTFMQTGTFIK